MTATGTFERPITLADPCPSCGHLDLIPERPQLVEAVLAAFVLDEEKRRQFDQRVACYCRECGWRGTAWRARQ